MERKKAFVEKPPPLHTRRCCDTQSFRICHDHKLDTRPSRSRSNELAGQAAKRAALPSAVDHSSDLTLEGIAQCMKPLFTEQCGKTRQRRDVVACSVRCCKSSGKEGNKWREINVREPMAAILTNLRTSHNHLNECIHQFSFRGDPTCCCGGTETVEQFLIEC